VGFCWGVVGAAGLGWWDSGMAAVMIYLKLGISLGVAAEG
jgi:hypothetical protein